VWNVIIQDDKLFLIIHHTLPNDVIASQQFEITTHSDEPTDLAWYREMLQDAMRSVAEDKESK